MKRGLWSTVAITFGLSIIICLVLYVFGSSLIGLFGVEGEGLGRGVEMLHFYGLVLFVFGFQMVINGVLQGAGDVMIQSAATLISLGVRVALGYLGVHFGILDYHAAWVTDPIGMLIATVIVVTRYASGKWKTKAVVSLSSDGAESEALPVVCSEPGK